MPPPRGRARAKISVIVPVYNTEESRLRRCIETLIGQTLREIEIIIVLDAPTDNSEQVAWEYAEGDKRIKVFTQPHNQGVSAARNIGLEMAQGEYIGFSDSDDYQAVTMYEELYQTATTEKADIVACATHVINEDRTEQDVYFSNYTKRGMLQSLFKQMHDKDQVNVLSYSVWHSIYKRSMIHDNEIRFEDWNRIISEDQLFNLECHHRANKISYVPKPLYIWDKHEGSLGNKWHTNLAQRELKQLQLMYNVLLKNGTWQQYYNDFYRLMSYYINLHYADWKNASVSIRQQQSELIQQTDFPILLVRYDLKLISKKRLKLISLVWSLKHMNMSH